MKLLYHFIFFCKQKNEKDPYFVTGLIDAEGCFMLQVTKNYKCLLDFSVQPVFVIGLHDKDLGLLYEIKSYFGVGNIKKGKGTAYYSVTKTKDLVDIIIPHFMKYSLITKKKADFILFSQAVGLVNKKEHLKEEGLHQIISIRASMNKGLSDELKCRFTGIIPVSRPEVVDP